MLAISKLAQTLFAKAMRKIITKPCMKTPHHFLLAGLLCLAPFVGQAQHHAAKKAWYTLAPSLVLEADANRMYAAASTVQTAGANPTGYQPQTRTISSFSGAAAVQPFARVGLQLGLAYRVAPFDPESSADQGYVGQRRSVVPFVRYVQRLGSGPWLASGQLGQRFTNFHSSAPEQTTARTASRGGLEWRLGVGAQQGPFRLLVGLEGSRYQAKGNYPLRELPPPERILSPFITLGYAFGPVARGSKMGAKAELWPAPATSHILSLRIGVRPHWQRNHANGTGSSPEEKSASKATQYQMGGRISVALAAKYVSVGVMADGNYRNFRPGWGNNLNGYMAVCGVQLRAMAPLWQGRIEPFVQATPLRFAYHEESYVDLGNYGHVLAHKLQGNGLELGAGITFWATRHIGLEANYGYTTAKKLTEKYGVIDYDKPEAALPVANPTVYKAIVRSGGLGLALRF